MDSKPGNNFRSDIEHLVRQIPAGRVTTYGDLAAMAGHPYASRVVGGVAHYGDDSLPWQRVVNRFGGLASGYPGGRAAHAQHLKQDDVSTTDQIVDNFKEKRWRPDLTSL